MPRKRRWRLRASQCCCLVWNLVLSGQSSVRDNHPDFPFRAHSAHSRPMEQWLRDLHIESGRSPSGPTLRTERLLHMHSSGRGKPCDACAATVSVCTFPVPIFRVSASLSPRRRMPIVNLPMAAVARSGSRLTWIYWPWLSAALLFLV